MIAARYFWKRRPAVRPGPDVEDRRQIDEVALQGADYPGVRPRLLVSEGDRVAAGQPILVDRLRPQIAVTAPLASVVRSIRRGPRRSLGEIVLDRDGRDAESFEISDVRSAMLTSGLWATFRTRPFGLIPDPDARPEAIFVTATPRGGAAPDPRPVIEASGENFGNGVAALEALTDGAVHVCQTAGPDLASGSRVRCTVFEGVRQQSPSAQVDRLRPVGPARQVWIIDYADAISLGVLLSTGRLMRDRVITLAGSAVDRPRLIRTFPGASLRDLISPYLVIERPLSVLVGPTAARREAAWLGARDQQVTVVPRLPLPDEPARLRPIVPGERLEDVLPIATHTVPLMRALSIGDAETAERLGALALVEEDVAPLNGLCTSGARYDRLLRRVLDDLAGVA